VRNLAAYPEFRPETIEKLAALPGFRNVLLHGYVSFDLDRAVSAFDRLDAVQDFVRVAARLVEQLE
jgi:uncharacterized protein YutE (UPF0331/DUF86 family)